MYNLSKKTKIICTIGPASDNKETLEKLLAAGMCCMRINLSHGNHEEHLKKINLLTATMENQPSNRRDQCQALSMI